MARYARRSSIPPRTEHRPALPRSAPAMCHRATCKARELRIRTHVQGHGVPDGVAIVPVLKGRMLHREPGAGVRGIPRGLLWLVPASGVDGGRQSSRQVRCDARREVGKPFVEECRKSIEVGEGVERPFDLYWPAPGRNSGVPHVRSHCTTRSCGTRESSAALADRRMRGFDSLLQSSPSPTANC